MRRISRQYLYFCTSKASSKLLFTAEGVGARGDAHTPLVDRDYIAHVPRAS